MMIRSILSFFFTCYVLVGFGQDNTIPASIQVPKGTSLILHTYAKGVQIYRCTPDPKDTSTYSWTFTAPRANLYTDSSYQQLVGKHYFDSQNNPTWQAADGSTVTGAKLQQVNSPDSAAIPWLLLKAAKTSGSGILTPTIFIQRVFTKGGKAPATAPGMHKGQTAEVPYTAEYLFYSEK